jgi:hypothetical protein
MRTSLAIILGLTLAGCGPTIGDPCTTAADCLGAICINRGFAPGGYCSATCNLDDARGCPLGSVCVRDALGRNAHSCFLTCQGVNGCRGGYNCQSVNGSSPVCVGPGGI